MIHWIAGRSYTPRTCAEQVLYINEQIVDHFINQLIEHGCVGFILVSCQSNCTRKKLESCSENLQSNGRRARARVGDHTPNLSLISLYQCIFVLNYTDVRLTFLYIRIRKQATVGQAETQITWLPSRSRKQATMQ